MWKVSVFGVFLLRIFPHLEWIRRDTESFCVYSPNAGKYRPEKVRIRTLCTQFKYQRKCAYSKIFLRQIMWILLSYYANYHVGRTKTFSPVHWRIKIISGMLKFYFTIRVEILIFLIFNFSFSLYSKIASFCPCDMCPSDIMIYETVKLLGYWKDQVFVLNVMKNLRWISLLLQNQALSLLPYVFEIELVTRFIFEKHHFLSAPFDMITFSLILKDKRFWIWNTLFLSKLTVFI